MKFIKIVVSICLIIFVIGACTKSRNSSESGAQNGGPGLLGIDSDHNGIRDDIDKYIKTHIIDSEKKRAALSQLARDYQVSLSVMNDEEKSIEASRKEAKSFNCVRAIYGRSLASHEMQLLDAEQYNTLERSLAAMKLVEFASKAGFIFPEESEWIKDCRFDVSKMRN